MLMIGVTDDYGKESNTEIIQVSQGEVVREHLDLKGIASHHSVAPLHEISYSVRRSADNIRTCIVTIMPRFVVVNILHCPIFVRQNDSPTVLVIPPGEREYLWWWAESHDRSISILPDDGSESWSAAFEIQGAESFLLHVRDKENKLRIFQACVTEGSTTVLTVCEELCPPVRIDNRSSYNIAIGEREEADGFPPEVKGGSAISQVKRHEKRKRFHGPITFKDHVPPLGSLDFVFSGKRHELALTLVGDNLKTNTATVEFGKSSHGKSGYAGSVPITDLDGDTVAFLDLKLQAAGPQTVLIILQRMAGEPPKPLPTPTPPARQLFELEIRLVGLGLSIVDTTRRCEVLHLCISGARYWATKWSPLIDENGQTLLMPKVSKEMLAAVGIGEHMARGNMAYQLTVDSIQVDCQRSEAAFPLVLSRVEHSLKPVLHFSVRRTLGKYGGGRVHHYEQINLIIHPLHIMVESALLNLFLGADSAWACVIAPYVDPFSQFNKLVPASNTTTATVPLRLYTESLRLLPTAVYVSFIKNETLAEIETMVSSAFVRRLLKNNVWTLSRFKVSLRGNTMKEELVRLDALAQQVLSNLRDDVTSNLTGRAIAAALRVPMESAYYEVDDDYDDYEDTEMVSSGVAAAGLTLTLTLTLTLDGILRCSRRR